MRRQCRRRQPPAAHASAPALLPASGEPDNLTPAFPCAVATAGGAADLYPSSSAAAIDGWLAAAAGIEAAAAAWCQPTCGAATPEQRAAAQQQLEAALAQLEAALASSAYLAGAAPTIADVAVLAALLPLFQEVLGQDVQQQLAAVTRWLQACAAQPQFAAVLGEPAGRVWLFLGRACCCILVWLWACMVCWVGGHAWLAAMLHPMTSPSVLPSAMLGTVRMHAMHLPCTCHDSLPAPAWQPPHRPLLPPRLACPQARRM